MNEVDVMVAVERAFRVNLCGGSKVHDRAEAVMAELVELSDTDDRLLDSSASSDEENRIVTLQVTVRAEDLDDGIAKAMVAMRAAIHMDMIAQTMHAEVVPA